MGSERKYQRELQRSIDSMVDEIEERYCADLTDMQRIELRVWRKELEERIVSRLEDTAQKAVLSLKARIKHGAEVMPW